MREKAMKARATILFLALSVFVTMALGDNAWINLGQAEQRWKCATDRIR